MTTTIPMAGLSDLGRVRSRNEDSLVLDPATAIAVVADGMGGHPGGDVASRVAAERAHELLVAEADARRDPAPAMEAVVLGAHQAVRAEGDREVTLQGMGTTLTALTVRGTRFVIGHVGDSRVYRLRGQIFEQLTRDDTWVQDRVEDGTVSPHKARRHPFAHMLTQCVGLLEAPRAQVLEGDAVPGDLYLVCSDGLTTSLEDRTIQTILGSATAETLDASCEGLVAAANDAGGTDNTTVALLLVPER